MAEERALVLEVKGEQVHVQTQRVSACQSCQIKSSCGQSLLSKIGSEKTIEFVVDNSLSAKPGDIVVVSIPDQGLLLASSLMFMLPLSLMVVAAMLAGAAGLGEAGSIILGVSGLFAGFWFARRYSQSMHADERFKPVMKALALSQPQQASCHSALSS